MVNSNTVGFSILGYKTSYGTKTRPMSLDDWVDKHGVLKARFPTKLHFRNLYVVVKMKPISQTSLGNKKVILLPFLYYAVLLHDYSANFYHTLCFLKYMTMREFLSHARKFLEYLICDYRKKSTFQNV